MTELKRDPLYIDFLSTIHSPKRVLDWARTLVQGKPPRSRLPQALARQPPSPPGPWGFFLWATQFSGLPH